MSAADLVAGMVAFADPERLKNTMIAEAERQPARKPGVALPGVTWTAWGRN